MDLPDAFDVIVVGTGLTETLVASSAARAGKRVLNLDGNSFYGARNTTFSLKAFAGYLRGEAPEAWARDEQPADAPPAATIGDAPRFHVEHVPDTPRHVEYVDAEAPTAEMLAKSHRYNIDLTPALLLSAVLSLGRMGPPGAAALTTLPGQAPQPTPF